MLRKVKPVLLLIFVVSSGLWAQSFPDLLNGADTMMDLFAPVFAGGGAFSTSLGGASASAINPAAGGEVQRIVFEAGYMAIPGFRERGFGNAINLGALFPTKFASLGGSLNFLNSPFPDWDGSRFLRNAEGGTLPVKFNFGGNFNVAKELYPGLDLGAGLNFGFGNPGENWTLSGDLGFRYNLGTLGVLENFTIATVVKGLGKNIIPSAFTPVFGISTDLLHLRGSGENVDPLKLTGYLDLSAPGFRNFTGKLGLSLLLAEMVYVSTSWGFNVLELYRGIPLLFPSVGAGVNIALKSGGKRIIGGRLPSDGDLTASAAFKPLYNGSAAIGAGLTWNVGVSDKRAPAISVDYPETQWISPNHDGLADDLEIPIRITDQRYVVGWTLEIRNEAGEVVRTYRNKELRPETQGFKNFFSRFAAVKAGVEIPEILRWDGVFDSGEPAPDGRYYFTLSAVDDNDNSGKTEDYETVIDNTPPEVSIVEMSESQRIFSPDGDGNKDTIEIAQSGSTEDLWTGGIFNASGDRVKTFEFANTVPEPIIWDGTDDKNFIVPDGVYEYRISATDKAKNIASTSLHSIVISTIQPTVNLQITDAYFSPNGDGIKDALTLNPGIPVKESIVSWELLIRDGQANPRRTISGSEGSPPASIDFDGKDDDGTLLPEGAYHGKLSVKYRNGYVAEAFSPSFTLDVTPPRAAIRAEYGAFSPNNDGNQDEMIIAQEGSAETLWTGEVRRAAADSEQPVRTFRINGAPGSRIIWDGQTDSGALAPDGEYVYRLSATDQAGNPGRSNEVRFTLSTADTPVLLSTDVRAFSPTGAGAKNRITIVPQLQLREGVTSWKTDILNTGGSAVRTFEGVNAVPASLPWDGRTTGGQVVPDGTYTAKIEVRYAMGNQPTAVSRPFVVDTQAPKAEITTPFATFSPNSDSRRDSIPINVSAEGNDEWELSITDSKGQIIRSWKWAGAAPAISWDGADEAKNPVPDGVYRVSLSSTDEAGNSFRKTIDNITVDARAPRVFLTSSASGIAPLPGANRNIRLGIILSIKEGIESWKLDLASPSGAAVRSFPDTPSAVPPETIVWNGLDASGAIREGRYTPTLTVTYAKGDVVTVQTAPVTVDISGPELAFRSTPEYFSPDNDGVDDDLFMSLIAKDASPLANWSLEIWEVVIDSQGRETSRKSFYRIEGRGAPSERLTWDGRSSRGELVQAATDYPFTFKAEDVLGNASSMDGKIGIDVLVIRDGDRLKIQVPSIIFRANAADFNGLAQSIGDNNYRILKRIAEILNKFRDYKITVEGHANPTTPPGSQARRNEENGSPGEIGLQPLSENRAKATVDFLVGFGVNRSRLSSIGMGGTRAVISFEDRDNWWKNRRVEFILIK
ncbi:MAG: gliding motility-associated C-terminal domain-containing protein [Treponema sp.]|jgi:flagellar hook assembly protein FlgD/outer membrane protein OmpA-like peptidoglycan-associated protein|nr:gliding motility-associated C-terminal domain-containing protein [Treponema sp.]